MESARVLERLKSYEAELDTIRSRFVRTQSSIRIAGGDSSRLHQLVIELRDLFNDLFGGNSYSELVVSTYNEGISNHLASPSLSSVERILNVVRAALTRVQENPQVLLRSPAASDGEQEVTNDASTSRTNVSKLPAPEKVTLRWLYEHLPHGFWVSGLALLAAAFALGATAVFKISLVQQWFGAVCTTAGTG